MRVGRLLLLVPLIALGASGCSAEVRALPTTTGPRVLAMAYTDKDLELDPGTEAFVEEVARVSRGRLVVKPDWSCCGTGDDSAQRLIAGTAKGRWALGVTSARDLAEAGAAAAGALSAPRLIDSYAAESAVLGSDVPASILPALKSVGVDGIGWLPGTLRRPISNGKALREPKDWRGRTFWTFRSATSSAAIEALGATASDVANPVRDDQLQDGRLQGAENAVVWADYTEHVPHAVITIDEALWPRIQSVFAAPGLHLTPQQRAWLRSAVTATGRRTEVAQALDAGSVPDACAKGIRFATATAAQIAATDTAVAPVVAKLEEDRATRTAIERIRALKPASLPREYDIPAACRAG